MPDRGIRRLEDVRSGKRRRGETAKVFGVAIPRSVLERADQVIQ